MCASVCNTGYTGFGHGNLIVKLAVLQCQKTGHDLNCAGRRKRGVHILGIEDRIGSIFHDHGRCGSDLRPLRPAADPIGGNTGGCSNSGSFCGENWSLEHHGSGDPNSQKCCGYS